MVFSSLYFLFVFLPIVLLGYLIIPNKYSNYWLLASSIYFYYCGGKDYLAILLIVIISVYIGGLFISYVENIIAKRIAFIMCLIELIAIMTYFKYWNFLIDNLNMILSCEIKGETKLILPIGISFYSFQAISYLVDVYRGDECIKNPSDMALYITFFPQLIAGPIVRYSDIKSSLDVQIREKAYSNFMEGVERFSVGLCKKVLLANNLGSLADIVFNVADISMYSVMYSWLGALAYSLQIYFDFSGYSDMAIGLGRIFGFKFQENFNYPYIAKSVRDFWKRWHISLSQFFRDYVYIPLGGSYCGKGRNICNLMFVWLLTGMWHGASWTYILWGLLYGILLIIEKFIKSDKVILNEGVKRIITLIIVICMWTIFRAETLTSAISMLGNMFGVSGATFIDSAFWFQLNNFWFLLLVAGVLSTPIVPYLEKRFEDKRIYGVMSRAILGIGVICCISFIYMGSYNPFLYFMF